MPTYNGIEIPTMIRTNCIISAFVNEMDESKICEYVDRIQNDSSYLPHAIPAIHGYPDVITEDDLEKDLVFLTGEVVDANAVGQVVWYVTDGHHRSVSAIRAGLRYLNTAIDLSCFTNYDELQAYRMQC